MAKIVAWLILIFVVLLAWRMISLRNARARRRDAKRDVGAAAQPMVRCLRCGVFLPRAEARAIAGGHVCPDGHCAEVH